MARPLKEGMDYFPHDTDASNDEKIDALRALHGNDGYAFYFILLERIYRSPNAELDISKPAVKAALIKKVGVTPEKFEQMLLTAFDIDCLNRDAYEEDQILTSNGVKRRFREVQNMRERWRNKRKDNNGVIPRENTVENQVENSEETGESKEKKRKENINTHDNNNTSPARTDLIIVFEKEFARPMSPFEIEQVLQWEAEHSAELVLEALKRAVLMGKYTLKYINSILTEWKKNHVMTLQDVAAFDAEFQKKKVKSLEKARGAPKSGQARAPAENTGDKKKKDFIRSLYI